MLKPTLILITRKLPFEGGYVQAQTLSYDLYHDPQRPLKEQHWIKKVPGEDVSYMHAADYEQLGPVHHQSMERCVLSAKQESNLP